MGAHGVLDVLGQVVPQVPAVGDLGRLGCPDPGALGVGPGPVSADHLGARVGGQPVGEGLRLAVVEHIDGTVAGHVDQHGAVVLPAS
jgi:hypothetical protein